MTSQTAVKKNPSGEILDVDSTTTYVTEASVRRGGEQLNQSQLVLSGRGVNWDYWAESLNHPVQCNPKLELLLRDAW